ncbi:hypothetical protein [Paraburkholderia guartelaensis]|uniref:hypothetical protein n=1 Tax=Paraburkholderia guartelaensis TaxID=2546446 RepID=UPI002AB65452|nr:hypothetical protein [Paraburkholderia guartelaensis]
MSGGRSLGEANRAEFAQLKYSSANPNSQWTIARLASNSAKNGNNSVIRKLAEAYQAAEYTRATKNPSLAYSIRLVSNQQIADDVLTVLGKRNAPDKITALAAKEGRRLLRKAAGLSEKYFSSFASLLDFSECGTDSLFEQERKAIRILDRLIEGETRPSHLELHRFISDAMLPESSREPITEEAILSRLDVGTEYALYPCPNRVMPVSNAIDRAVARDIVSKLVDGTQRIVLHGGAGCGKTTTISQISSMLPSGSVCIQYDCYGGGSYLDNSAPRHRPLEAFTQLSNEIAIRLRVPRLLRISEKGSPVRAFKERLDLGADVLLDSNPEALLVIAIDAADNAVAVAGRRSEHCFVRELASIGDLRSNVRILVSARTARMTELELPPNFLEQQIEPFSLDETLANACVHVATPDANWVKEFHGLTRGVPRVQAYAFELSTDPAEAIQFLLPGGKGLSEIFEQAFDTAWRKGGDVGSIAVLCAALISLPRPVPLTELAYIIDRDLVRTTDLCEDLGRTIVIKENCVSFSDEDFEDFVAQRGSAEQQHVRERIAEHFLTNQRRGAYACRHVVQALIDAEREADALRVATEEPEGKLFADPIERRLCHLERMRGALRVCGRSGSPVESMYILLVGAEALRTSDAIAKALALNPDLSARHARESLDRLVLSDERYVEANGPVLCHLMAEDARSNLFVQAERSRRLFFAWQSKHVERRDYRQHSQHMTTVDVAAFYRAEAARGGLEAVLKRFRRRHQHRDEVFREFVTSLLGNGDYNSVERLLADSRMPSEARVYLASLLAQAGRKIDLAAAAAQMNRLRVRGRFKSDNGARRARGLLLREDSLSLCEVLVRVGRSIDVVRSVLADIVASGLPRWRHIELSNHSRIDELLRAQCLLAELDGRTLTTAELLDVESDTATGWNSDSDIPYQDHQKRSDIVGFFSAYLPFYEARARYIKRGRLEEFAGAAKVKWMKRAESAGYSSSRNGARGMHYQLAESVSALLAVEGEHIRELFKVATELIATSQATFGSREARVLRPFTWRSESHGALTTYADACLPKINDLRTSSSEKASSLLELSRLLLNCSPDTSGSLFSKAVLVLEDVDVSEMRLLGIFEKLSNVASGALTPAESRCAAMGLAAFGTVVALRLRDYEHFPWAQLSRGLTYLNAPVALAAAARWDDEGLASISEALNEVLIAGAKTGSIPAQYAAACSYLSNHVPERLISEVVRLASELDDDARLTVHEILAECEALARNPNPRPNVDSLIVGGAPSGRRRRWTTYLAYRSEFARPLAAAIETRERESTGNGKEQGQKIRSFLDSLDWANGKFRSAADIAAFAEAASDKARDEHSLYFIGGELFARVRALIPENQRCSHLSHLLELALAEDVRYEVIEALTDAVVEWSAASMAVRDWCATSLPAVISAKLMTFMVSMRTKPLLTTLIDEGCISGESVYPAILAGLAENIEEFDASRIYDLIEIIAGLVSVNAVASVVCRYVERLSVRVRKEDHFDSADIPELVDEAFARLLYAYLSDADLAIRWRAAHAVRSLFWLQQSSVIDALVSRYDVASEPSFRAEGAPFYWLAARLWLTIAVSRACKDRPGYAVRYASRMLSILDDHKFPHLLVRAFAKQGVTALAEAGVLTLTKDQKKALSKVDSSNLRSKQRPRHLDHDEHNAAKLDERRFQFDAMDTLRYWYPGMARIFADISLTDFTNEAERWIVDKWEVTSNPWRWDEETRREKFKHNPYAMHHSHGELPRVERFHTHLEWHAMWCAAGELLKSHPLATSEYDNDGLAEEIASSITFAPTLWLSDLRSPKPLEERFWLPAQSNGNWVHEPSVAELVALLGLSDSHGWCVVHADYDCYWVNLHESVRVTSCLVSPETAPALLRALQSSGDVHGHYLPCADDRDDGIDSPPFKLKGWLEQTEGRSGLDSKDRFADGMSPHFMQPGADTQKALNLVPSTEFIFGWEQKSTLELTFYAEQWADVIPDRARRDEAEFVRASGKRLHCRRHAIQEVLLQEQCDLLIKVTTYRKEYEEHRYSESNKGESAYFVRYILVTSQGDIRDAAGYVGAWKISGQGDGRPRRS